jgi:hypothetical protein
LGPIPNPHKHLFILCIYIINNYLNIIIKNVKYKFI